MELHVVETAGNETVVLLDDEMRIIKPIYDYLKYQRQKGRALNTLKANGNDLRTYWKFLSEHGYGYNQLSPNIMAEFIDYLRCDLKGVLCLHKESVRTGKTINRILSSVYQFYKYCSLVQEIQNPIIMEDINRPNNMFESFLHHISADKQTKQSIFKVKETTRPIKLLTDAESKIFCDSLNRQRDKLLFKALYLTGARIQEVLDLKIEDIPVPDSFKLIGVLKQIKSKGKRRDLYIPMTLIEELDDFIIGERSVIDTEHNYIFVSEQSQNLGNHLSYRGIYEVFKKVQKKTGVYFNFHNLRHTFISTLVEGGMDVSIVRILAGHEHISTTQKYTHLTDTFILESLTKYWKQTSLIGGTADD